MESWSGRSSSTTPRMASSSRRASSIESRTTRCRGGMPSQSRRSSAPSAPHTQAVAHDVVGRRTPTADELQPGQRVERRGLAGAGRAGDRDHGVVGREPQPAGRPARAPPGSRRAARRGADRARPRSPRRGPRCARRCRCSGRPASWPPPARTSWSPRSGRSAAGGRSVVQVIWRKPSGRAGPRRSTRRAPTGSARRRRVAPPSRSWSGVCGVEGEGVEQVDVAGPLGVDQLADADGERPAAPARPGCAPPGRRRPPRAASARARPSRRRCRPRRR